MPPRAAGSRCSRNRGWMSSSTRSTFRGLPPRALRPVRVAQPPIRRRAFWAVQALVLLIAVAHTLLETAARVEFPPELYLVPTSLFFIPVVYAALRFGVRGSVPTALWSIVLTMPNVFVLHDGLTRVGILWQETILLATAFFVGLWVDRERAARAETEAREDARRSIDERYQSLFGNAAEAVLVVGPEGRIEEANAAAGRLLHRPLDEIVGLEVARVAGPEIAEEVPRTDRTVRPMMLPNGVAGASVWVEVLASEPLIDQEGRGHVQVFLRDVTLQTERQQGLESYARRTVRTREEERRRIGRELHDGPLQSLMLLLRDLDMDGLAGAKSTAMATSIADARDLAGQTADELRRISRALRPSILDDLGLVAAIRSEASALARRSELDVRFETSGSPAPLPSEVELVLLRVAQEALHNVERHAAASSVFVRLRFGTCRTCLVVTDDGRGLGDLGSASGLVSSGRLGMVGMEERTHLVGGTFIARTNRREGTSIVVGVPIVR